jgi:hypothetical protein
MLILLASSLFIATVVAPPRVLDRQQHLNVAPTDARPVTSDQLKFHKTIDALLPQPLCDILATDRARAYSE